MAEEKGKPGLLAILGVGKKGSEEESDEPGSAKARAVKAFYDACKSGDWDSAAEEFSTAYDLCQMGDSESSDEEE